MAGFALATTALHLLGIGFVKVTTHFKLQSAIRVAGMLFASWWGAVCSPG